MRNQHSLKLFLVLIISTTYIFSFSHFGAQAYDSVLNRNDMFAEGTKIGSLSVSEKTVSEAMQLIDEQLTKWLSETSITLKYKEKSEQLDLSYLNFDIEKTVLEARHGQDNPILVELEPLDDFLSILSPTLTVAALNVEELEGIVLQSATMLESGKFDIRLDSFLTDSSSNESIISQSSIAPEFVEKEIDFFAGKRIEIPATSQFSLLKFVEDEGETLSALSLSKMATAIYGVILPTNFDMIERHISNELPAYATLGFEAKADIDLKNDLVFSNPNEFSFFLEFEKKNDSLIVYLKGPQFLNQYVVLSEDEETFKPKIIRQFNPLLGPTEIQVKIEGKDGQIIKVYREHRDESGSILKKELIAEDFYPPVHRVEVQGLIMKEGNSSIVPGTENEGATDEETNPDPNNSEQIPETSNPNESPDQQDEEEPSDLWGKEKEYDK